MAKFAYSVKDKKGKSLKSVMSGANKESVITTLQAQDYFIISVKELKAIVPKQAHKKRKKRTYSRKKIKLEDLLAFSTQLATMLEAGVPLIRCLQVTQSQVQSEQFANIIVKIRSDVERGTSLNEALAKHPTIFSQFWISLVEVGEASGTIPIVLNKLTFYLEQQAAFRSAIVSGLIYPAILCCVAMGAIFFFALFVGPRFETIFNSMGAELPLITKMLLSTFKFIKTNLLILFLGFAGTVYLLKKYLKTYYGKIMFERFLLKLPKAGEVYRLIVVERFASQMAILLESGVPILYALDICERLVDNNICALIINDIKEDVKKGKLLADPMEKSGFFPPMCIQMIMVGEETGELSKMLKHVSVYYQNIVETFMNRFETIVEPFMLVFMGVVIGTIVLAMFLPMFNIAQLGGAGG